MQSDMPHYELDEINLEEGFTTVVLRNDLVAFVGEMLRKGMSPKAEFRSLLSLSSKLRLISQAQNGERDIADMVDMAAHVVDHKGKVLKDAEALEDVA